MKKFIFGAALALCLPFAASADRLITCQDESVLVLKDKTETSSPIEWEQYQTCTNNGSEDGYAITFPDVLVRKAEAKENVSQTPAVTWNWLGFWERQ